VVVMVARMLAIDAVLLNRGVVYHVVTLSR